MRHQAHHVARGVADPRDVVGGPVRVVVVVGDAVGVAVAEHHQALVLDPTQVLGARHELSFAVLHRDLDDLARPSSRP